MAEASYWMIVPGNPALSALLIFALAMPFLYAARKSVHDLVHSVAYLANGPLRLVSRWLLAVAKDMRWRNRQVLLAQGREETGQHIAREFERVAVQVRRDLEGYTALQRSLLDEITHVQEDSKKSGTATPTHPDLVVAITYDATT